MMKAPELDALAIAGPVRRKYALLLNPFYPKDPHTSFGKHVLTPSVALTSVAAATPGDWEVRYWDENLLQGPPPLNPMPEVVGITVHLTFATRAFELAAWYRQRGAMVILGGLHAQSCPEECAPHADVVAVGDGTRLWPEILRDMEWGKLKREYRMDYCQSYWQERKPRREVLDRRSFLTTTSLMATRGCHNRCGFCYLATDALHMPWQSREAQAVAEEFRADGQPYGVFIDNNLSSRPGYLRELCRALRPLEKIWSAAVSLDVTDEPGLVREMALAGCTGVFIGFESLTDANLAEARKKTPRVAEYGRRAQMFHEHGIQVNGSFVLGFDHDGPECFERTCTWIEKERLECATFHILTPYPGTPLFRQMEAEGRLLHRNWERYDTGHVVFRPRKMTVEELEGGYALCYQRLFSHGSIWRRRPMKAGMALPYLAMSYLYKRANWLWPVLIRHRLTGPVWRPLVELSRRRHVRERRRWLEMEKGKIMPSVGVAAGVCA